MFPKTGPWSRKTSRRMKSKAQTSQSLNNTNQTLQSMIQRFEEEYPETRPTHSSPRHVSSLASAGTHPSAPLSVNTSVTSDTRGSPSDEDYEFEDSGMYKPALSRHNSDVSVASRALAIEEGHLHRLGHRMRRNIVDSPATNTPPGPMQCYTDTFDRRRSGGPNERG